MHRDIGGWTTRLTDEMIERYTSSGTWANVTLAQHAERCAREHPDRVAVVEADRSATFGALLAEARRLAAAMRAGGMAPGDVVSFQLPNWIEAMVVNLAACLGGFVCNPIVPIYREAEVRFILTEARSKLLFVPRSFRSFDYAAMIRRLRPALPNLTKVVTLRGEAEGCVEYERLLDEATAGSGVGKRPAPNAVKLLLYTSGTTAEPKGVLHSHNTLGAEIQAVARYWELTRDDVVFMPSPVTHITGYLYSLELPFAVGARVVYMDRWDAREAVELVRRHGGTFTVAATPFLAELVAELDRTGTELPSLRIFGSGGAPVPPEIVRRSCQRLRGCAVVRVYGSSEAPTVSLGSTRPDQRDLGATTDGQIVNHEVRICDPVTGEPLAPGQEGEITTRGPEVMLGYTNPELTREAFDSDGYFHSGDLGFVSHGDFITVSGRKKDLIIRGGEKISPKELEDVIIAHEAVQEVAVVGMPHGRLGETPCAFVVLKEGHAFGKAEVTALLESAGLARQKIPERVEIVDAMPRTASGKVQKHILRDRARRFGEPPTKAG